MLLNKDLLKTTHVHSTYTSDSGVILSSSGSLCSRSWLALSFPIFIISYKNNRKSTNLMNGWMVGQTSNEWMNEEINVWWLFPLAQNDLQVSISILPFVPFIAFSQHFIL